MMPSGNTPLNAAVHDIVHTRESEPVEAPQVIQVPKTVNASFSATPVIYFRVVLRRASTRNFVKRFAAVTPRGVLYLCTSDARATRSVYLGAVKKVTVDGTLLALEQRDGETTVLNFGMMDEMSHASSTQSMLINIVEYFSPHAAVKADGLRDLKLELPNLGTINDKLQKLTGTNDPRAAAIAGLGDLQSHCEAASRGDAGPYYRGGEEEDKKHDRSMERASLTGGDAAAAAAGGLDSPPITLMLPPEAAAAGATASSPFRLPPSATRAAGGAASDPTTQQPMTTTGVAATSSPPIVRFLELTPLVKRVLEANRKNLRAPDPLPSMLSDEDHHAMMRFAFVAYVTANGSPADVAGLHPGDPQAPMQPLQMTVSHAGRLIVWRKDRAATTVDAAKAVTRLHVRTETEAALSLQMPQEVTSVQWPFVLEDRASAALHHQKQRLSLPDRMRALVHVVATLNPRAVIEIDEPPSDPPTPTAAATTGGGGTTGLGPSRTRSLRYNSVGGGGVDGLATQRHDEDRTGGMPDGRENERRAQELRDLLREGEAAAADVARLAEVEAQQQHMQQREGQQLALSCLIGYICDRQREALHQQRVAELRRPFAVGVFPNHQATAHHYTQQHHQQQHNLMMMMMNPSSSSSSAAVPSHDQAAYQYSQQVHVDPSVSEAAASAAQLRNPHSSPVFYP